MAVGCSKHPAAAQSDSDPVKKAIAYGSSGELGMATITLKSIAPGEINDPKAVVTFEIQTSVGLNILTFPLIDQGSPITNEAEALRRLDIFLREALDALESLGTT
jgi:hypothetical protein